MNRILRFTNPNSWPTESVLRCDLYENIEPPDLDQESISFLTECTQAQWEISETRPSKRRKIKRDEKEPFDTRNETFAFRLLSGLNDHFLPIVQPPLAPNTVGYPPPTEDTSIQAENRRSRAEAAAVDIGWLLSERDKPLKSFPSAKERLVSAKVNRASEYGESPTLLLVSKAMDQAVSFSVSCPIISITVAAVKEKKSRHARRKILRAAKGKVPGCI